MGTSQWTVDLSVGHDILDEHHRTLFGLLAELSAGKATATEGWARSLSDRLISYTNYHFREEEALLQAAEYPFLQFHRGSHQAIAMRMRGLLDGLGQRPLAEVLAEVEDFLEDWLTHHIEIEDFEYKPYLSQRG